MEYKYHEEERKYKYGPGEKFESYEDAKAYIYMLRNQVLTKLSLAGYNNAYDVQEIHDEATKCISIKISIKYPVNYF